MKKKWVVNFKQNIKIPQSKILKKWEILYACKSIWLTNTSPTVIWVKFDILNVKCAYFDRNIYTFVISRHTCHYVASAMIIYVCFVINAYNLLVCFQCFVFFLFLLPHRPITYAYNLLVRLQCFLFSLFLPPHRPIYIAEIRMHCDHDMLFLSLHMLVIYLLLCSWAWPWVSCLSLG